MHSIQTILLSMRSTTTHQLVLKLNILILNYNKTLKSTITHHPKSIVLEKRYDI